MTTPTAISTQSLLAEISGRPPASNDPTAGVIEEAGSVGRRIEDWEAELLAQAGAG